MSVFMSYSTAAHAADDYDIIDAAEDVLNICIVIGGLIFAPATDGISLLATTKNILGLRDSIEGLRDYITDNGDGTYTISEEFIQAALDAAQELESRGFHDFKEIQNASGLYSVVGSSAEVYQNSHYIYKFYGTADFRPYAILLI